MQDDAEKMTYDEINYILEDLNLKLDIKIVPPPPAFFGKKKATPEDKYSSCNSIFLTRMDSQSLVTKVGKSKSVTDNINLIQFFTGHCIFTAYPSDS